MNETLRRLWPAVLVAIVALLYVWIGLTAHGADRILGIVGGIVILGALVVAVWSSWATMMLFAIGALPLAITTWWSIVTPVLGVLTLLLGWLATRNLSHARVEAGESTLESPA